MAVWVHNNSSHQFSDLPPQYLVCNPAEMAEVRQNDYRKYPNYRYMKPYYSIENMDEYGPMVFGNDEKYYVEVQKDKPGERYRYKQFIKGKDRHLFNTVPRELRYIVGNKFLLKGDDINTDKEADERVRTVAKIKKRTKHGVITRTLPVHEIRWKGLWDKNSDNLYALNQLLPQSKFKGEDEEQFMQRKTKYVKLFEQARDAIMSNN